MIVVGYSAGSFGRACLEQAITEAQVRDTDLLVINAVSESRGQRVAEPEEIVEAEQRLASAGVRFRISQPVGVTPAEELLTAMDAPDAEMLIIGMRRRTQVGKLLLGGTSRYLLIECRKPVLVVKPAEAHRRDQPATVPPPIE